MTQAPENRIISVIIPARNEEGRIASCIEATQKSASYALRGLEIVVVLNRCTDRTAAIAQGLGARTISCDAKNLSTIRNTGVAASHGDIVVTIDADSLMSTGMLAAVEQALDNGRTVGGGVLILPERWSLGILLTGMALLPIALWHGILGGLFYCTRQDFDAIGGFNETLVSAEDIDFAVRLKKYGAQTGRSFKNFIRHHVVTSCRKFDHFGDWYFILRPWKMWKLLRGRNQALADTVWYDFPREKR